MSASGGSTVESLIDVFFLILCRELVDKNPSAHTCLLLGDAYMSIQEVSAVLSPSITASLYFIVQSKVTLTQLRKLLCGQRIVRKQ